MAKILILYYGMHGHIEVMARTVTEGARSVENTAVAVIKRVPELMPEKWSVELALSSIRRHRLQQWTNCRTMMPLFPAPQCFPQDVQANA